MKDAIAKARAFADKYFNEELASKSDSMEKFPMELVELSRKENLLDYSNPWKVLVTIEELCRRDPGLGISVTIPAFGSEVLMLFGSDKLKEKYLNRVVEGKAIMGLGVTEPGGGSDVASIKTEAKREGDHYVLNGGKMFISNGQIADFFIVLARTSPPPSPDKKHRGMSVFVVESKSKGFTANKLHGKLGVRATNTAAAFYCYFTHRIKEQSAGLLLYSCTILDEAIFLRVYGKLLYQYGEKRVKSA
jgi:alkylation response protein AidB-like acyl-CoA dehydrogenase